MGRVLQKNMKTAHKPKKRRSVGKRTLNSWDTDRMAKAMNEFAEGKLSLRQISRAWNIPKSTLQRRVSGKVQHCEHASGRRPALPKNVETQLCDYLKELARRGFPLRPMEVRSLVYQFAAKHGYSGIGSTKTMTAGRFWFKRFMRRHPELSLLKPEGLSVARAMGCNKEVVTKWFETYKKTLDELGIADNPSHIWNCDETGLQCIFVPNTVVSEKGSASYQITSGEKGETTTVLAGFNGIGVYAPLLVLFKGKRMKSEWAVGSPPDTLIRMTDNGWITTETFTEWAKTFCEFVVNDGKPHLLLLDGHSSHTFNMTFLDLMSSNNIHVMSFPSHTTHVLQPADKSLFKSLKAHWSTEGLNFNRKNSGKNPGKADFFKIFSPAWKKSATVENAQSGFRGTGLFPVSLEALPATVFLPSHTSERTLTEIAQEPTLPSAAAGSPSASEESPVCSSNRVTLPPPAVAPSPPAPDQSPVISSAPSTSKSGAVTDLCETAAEVETTQVSNLFEAILPVPVRKRPRSTRAVLKSPTHVLTSKEHSNFLKEKLSTKKTVSQYLVKDSGDKDKRVKKRRNQGKTKDQLKLKNKSVKGKGIPPVSCYQCHIEENSDADRALAQDWIRCCRCHIWCHEQCGEEGGVYDDMEFFCAKCAQKLA